MEVLTDPVKRRQFDSVDEGAEVAVPSKKAKGNFYKQWGPVFEAEGRFSKKHPVPKLGNENSTKEEVEGFYNFFYNFDSWRTFEYLDEDVPDDNENRDQKRYVERKNKAQRAKRKTEDNARLRKLVDDCLSLDPRIKLFKQKEREQKNAKKNAREAEEKKAAEEKKQREEEEKRRKEEEEKAAAAAKIDAKKAKEAAKNAAKKNKRVWKRSIEEVGYFADGAASPDDITKYAADIELLISKADPELLQSVAKKLEAAKGNKEETKKAYDEAVATIVGGGAVKASELRAFSA